MKLTFPELTRQICALREGTILEPPELLVPDFGQLLLADFTSGDSLSKYWNHTLCYNLSKLMEPVFTEEIRKKYGTNKVEEALLEWYAIHDIKIPSILDINKPEKQNRKLILTSFLNVFIDKVERFWNAKKRRLEFIGDGTSLKGDKQIPDYLIDELERSSDYCLANNLRLEEYLTQTRFYERIELL